MHDYEFDHYHADDGEILALEKAHPLWTADRVVLRSVGIDIGSSTTHLAVSRVVMRRQGAALSSRFQVQERRIEYMSPIMLTPFTDGRSLDVPRLKSFLAASYAEAGWDPSSVDTGAVITTGDAARKDNADAVVRLFAEQSGKFVCASAGPRLEAKMAAYGSGAITRSGRDEPSATVLNIDVGGGTSKLSIAHREHLHISAINVGARLITFDENGILTKVERAAQIASKALGFTLEVGVAISREARELLASGLAKALLEVIRGDKLSQLTRDLLITEPLHVHGDIDVVMFSGGVSEYIYENHAQSFGDIGPELARHLRAGLEAALPKARLERSSEGIRATVIGASQFTVQVSGNTLFVGDANLLPMRNLRIVSVTVRSAELSSQTIERAVLQALEVSEVQDGQMVGLAFRWSHGPAYEGLIALANGIARAADRHASMSPIIVLLDADLANIVGHLLQEVLGRSRKVLVIDGIEFHDLDYIDIGEVQKDSGVVTIVVKSLVFSG